MRFGGYLRPDGKFGIRNHVVVMSSVSCANGVVEQIVREVPGAVPITHGLGCGRAEAYTARTLMGIGKNANVAAVLVIGLGCEQCRADGLAKGIAESGKPVEYLVIQESGGSRKTTEKGIEIARRLVAGANQQRLVDAPFETLIVGLECGGSDAFSGVTANPSVGAAADMLVEHGATVIISETSEMIGTAHILKKRAASAEVAQAVEDCIKKATEHAKYELGERAGLSIAVGNIEGGLSSIIEKSLGCITKGGTTTINEVVDYAVAPSKKGLIVMDTPGYDVVSLAGMAAGGAQLMIFTTGRGTPVGFPIAPVIKVASNSDVFNRMPDDIDVDAGKILDGESTIQEVGAEIFRLVEEVVNGKQTKAEINQQNPFVIYNPGPRR